MQGLELECILSGYARTTNLAPPRAKPSGSDRPITQMIARPLVRLIGILSTCRIGEHSDRLPVHNNLINDRIEANELNELSEHFVSNPTETRRKSGFPRKLTRNPILIVGSTDFSEGTFSVKTRQGSDC
jgi:hypothetical protein